MNNDIKNRVGNEPVQQPVIPTDKLAYIELALSEKCSNEDIEKLKSEISEIKSQVEKLAKIDVAKQIDSARRTFGEEVSLFTLSVEKRLKALEQNNG